MSSKLTNLVAKYGEDKVVEMVERYVRDMEYRKDANKKWRSGQREKARAYDELVKRQDPSLAPA